VIVIVSSIVPPEHSGAGYLSFDFYKYLVNQGYEVSLVTHTPIKNDDRAIIIRKFQGKGPFRKLSLALTFMKSGFQLAIRFFFLRIKEPSIKAVWLTSANPLTFASAIVFHLLGYKIIVQNSLAGSDEPNFHYTGDFMSLKYKLKRLQYYLADVVTCISPLLFDLTKNFHHNCVLIPNPVNPKYKVKFTEPPERNMVLFVGELGRRKGVDIVFRTIDLVHKVNSKIRFILVGPEDRSDESMINDFHSSMYIRNEQVRFEGFVNDPTPYFSESDIFFMPSRREGFGIVFIEAMASGLPVIAKELGGITDYIFGNDYSTIFDTEDPQVYADAILGLLNNSDEYKRLADLGLHQVKRFEQAKIFNEYLGIVLY
jgi:glycosyltransferase involved in cell wall biosynthesis